MSCMHAESTRKATSRSAAGTVVKYCVIVCCVSASPSPPNCAKTAAVWSASMPLQPRNAMCSWACAIPGKPSGVSFAPTR